ncbi:TolC family protein [Acinetobacter ursingii]|uniref:TolC family protein n=1 Tax=Acinetobacter ursingii TaxID=108980 RepID=UPI003AF9F8EA
MKFRRQVYTTKPTFLTQTLFKIMAVGLGFTGLYAQVQAQSYSYAQAEQQVLENSYTSQANQALQSSAKLDAEAVKGLGLPRIDLNVRAYKFHSEVDVPLNSFKQGIENALNEKLDNQLNEWENVIPPNIIGDIENGVSGVIHDGVNMVPNYANLTLQDEQIRSSISMVMPLYTGGLLKSTKQIAAIQSQRSELNTEQQQDVQRFEMIQAYFNVQLQQQLLKSSQFNFNAMQRHLDNALKLEKQGFLSKGQRMQFEVARNNAQRLLQNAQANLQSSQFQLNNLLRTNQVNQLTTPLFVNKAQTQSLDNLMATYPEQSSLVRKMQMDTQIANENVRAQQAAKKPNLFAFGEYSLDDKENWIVGIAARYNLFSGIDKSKSIHSAELKRYATELLTARTKQEIENVLNKSYSELHSAQQTHRLLLQNQKAAQENLRIQELSFKEDMGTATQVIDAQNALNTLDSEMALNAYKYILSLATLLQSHGSISNFKAYVNQPNTDFIR